MIQELSLPHWRQHLLRTCLVLVTVAAGVAATAATLTVSESVLTSFERMSDVTSAHAELSVTNRGVGVPDVMIEEIGSVPEVEEVSAFVAGFAPLASNPSTVLEIQGFDLLADTATLARVPRSAIHVPNKADFLFDPSAIAVSRAFAVRHGLEVGESFDVLAPGGLRTLNVRGVLDDVGAVALFAGRVGVMDLAAAQDLLGRDRLVDRIDVRLREGADARSAARALQAVTGARAQIVAADDRGSRAKELLRSLRVILALVAAISVVVSFFIINHAINVSVVQRRYDVAVLATFGVAPTKLVTWILLEALVLGCGGVLIGVGAGLLLARVSLALFGTVSSAWLVVPPASMEANWANLALAAVAGAGTTALASILAARSTLGEAIADLLRDKPPAFSQAQLRRSIVWGVAALMAGAAFALVSGRALSYRSVVVIILIVNCSILIGLGLMSPLVVRVLGRAGSAVGDRFRGLAALVGSVDLARRPVAPVAVVTAIVLALGWTIANGVLVTSFQTSWFGWVEKHYHSDLIVTAAGDVTSILTARPFDQSVVEDVRTTPGVRLVQGLRRVEIEYDDHPTMLVAYDRAPVELPTLTSKWRDVEQEFWHGRGVFVSESLVHRTGIDVGENISVSTPSGLLQLPVIAVYRDVYGGDLGAIAISRSAYARHWGDHLVDRVRVWTDPPRDAVQARLNARLAVDYALEAVSYESTMAALSDLIRHAFAVTYALVFVSVVVSSIGILNFLLSRILERSRDYRVLLAVGASPRQVIQTVMTESLLIAAAGVSVGLLAGVVVSRVIIHHSVPMVNGWHFAYVFPFPVAAQIVVAIFLGALVASIVPGRLAARAGFYGRTE